MNDAAGDSGWFPGRGIGHGKVILLGEHAVVYGHRAVVAGLPLGVELVVAPADVATVDMPTWGVAAGHEPDVLRRATTAMLHAVGWQGARIQGKAALPAGAGLGSSAAYCVALARACLAPSPTKHDASEISNLASLGEQAFHGTPSGVDVAAAMHGGLGVFSTRGGFSALPPTPDASSALRLVVGASGVVRSTSDMVARVAVAATQPEGATHISKLGQLADDGILALAAGDWAALGEIFDDAHQRLSALGASHQRLDALAREAKAGGALGAKLTGAGGGGSAIALAPGREDEIAARWRQLGFEAFTVTLGGLP